MIHGRKSSILLLHLAVLFFATCGSTTEREQNILNLYNARSDQKYADLLVDPARYTTSGVEYHRKYYRYLIGIAGDIVEKKGLAVEKGSLGFYYDKRSGDRNMLYLGLDIDTGSAFEQPFDTVTVRLIRKDLKEVIQTINSCRTIFGEADIVGMVIGWVWTSRGAREHASVWIGKQDFIRYEDEKITFDELLMRSTVTNTIGRVFRLPL
ncbi:MAG: hypothetical protein JXA07_06820 [Spirochaetes bacterium]|nr:hypothetical protein [Spirochaetota bacterium]